MINLRQLDALAARGDFDGLANEALGAWRRRLPVSLRLLLTEAEHAAPVALGLALRRLSEVTHRPTAGARRMLEELLAWLAAFDDETPEPDPTALAAAAAGLLALAGQTGAELGLRERAAAGAGAAIDRLGGVSLRSRGGAGGGVLTDLPGGPSRVPSRSAGASGRPAFWTLRGSDEPHLCAEPRGALIAWLLAAGLSATAGSDRRANGVSPAGFESARGEVRTRLARLIEELDERGARFDRDLGPVFLFAAEAAGVAGGSSAEPLGRAVKRRGAGGATPSRVAERVGSLVHSVSEHVTPFAA